MEMSGHAGGELEALQSGERGPDLAGLGPGFFPEKQRAVKGMSARCRGDADWDAPWHQAGSR